MIDMGDDAEITDARWRKHGEGGPPDIVSGVARLLLLPLWRSATSGWPFDVYQSVFLEEHRRTVTPTLRESCFCLMANIKSQIKRNRQNEVRAARNKAAKSELKTRIKAVINAPAGEDAGELYRSAQKRIDMAVTKGLMHPNTAARRKSRLAKRAG